MNDLPEIPKEVVDAARTVQVWAETQGAKSWEIMGVCSRNYACAAEALAHVIQEGRDGDFGLNHGYGLKISEQTLARYIEMKGQ
jgi:hypothetical protein